MTSRDFAFVLIGCVFALATGGALHLLAGRIAAWVRRVLDRDFPTFNRRADR